MKNELLNMKNLLSIACAIVMASFGVTAVAQEVVAAKASVSSSYAESLKKYTERGDDGEKYVSYEVIAKDTYSASATFTLDAAPEDWTDYVGDITVTVGDLECAPVISKSSAKGGAAALKEKDSTAKSSLTCSVKWSKKTITVSLSGSNCDDVNVFGGGGDGTFADEVEIAVDLGGGSVSLLVPVNGKGKTVVKTIKTGHGEDATIDEYPLSSWSAKGTAKEQYGY